MVSHHPDSVRSLQHRHLGLELRCHQGLQLQLRRHLGLALQVRHHHLGLGLAMVYLSAIDNQ